MISNIENQIRPRFTPLWNKNDIHAHQRIQIFIATIEPEKQAYSTTMKGNGVFG